MKEFDLITIADLCVDIILTGDVKPNFRQVEKIIDDCTLEMGGSCSIFACQAAKLGLKTAVLGVVGRDVLGQFILESLKRCGVDTSYIREDKNVKTGVGVALNKGHNRAILTYIGSIDALSYSEHLLETIEKARHIHFGSYFILNRIRPSIPQIIRHVKESDMTISLDTNWDPSGEWSEDLQPILRQVDVFLPNDNELRAIMNERAFKKALSRATEIVPLTIVKCGEKGSVCLVGDRLHTVKAMDVKVVDTVGAGDSFDAGYLYGWLNGMSISKCMEIGNICGALNTTKAGGIAGQPTLEQIKNVKGGMQIE